MSKHALCIGINNYPGTGSDLHGCVNDANDWASILRSSGFEVSMLLDEEATKDAILDSMSRLTDAAGKGDTVIITFSGHGSFVPDLDGDEKDGRDECWCPYDVRENQIIDDEIYEVVSGRKSGVKWIILSDSCHSGTISRFAPIATPPTMEGAVAPQRLVRFLPPSVFLDDEEKLGRLERQIGRAPRSTMPGRKAGLAISGCQDHEFSYDAWFNGRANGAFTYVALSALKDLDDDADYEDWFDKISETLPSQQYPQTPNLTGSAKAKSWRVFGASGGRNADANEGPSGRETSLSGPAAIGRAIAAELHRERSRERRELPVARGAKRVHLAAIGDSWFDYPRNDIRDILEDRYGYEIESVAVAGARVEDMAYSKGQLRKLLRVLEKMARRNEPPKAVLLSGGGNDVAGDEFAALLNHRRSPQHGLNQVSVDGAMARIRDAYIAIISSVDELMRRELGKTVPIVIHGYDYPVPDGRGFLGGWWFLPGPWLRPALECKGYTSDTEMKAIVRDLIDQFNEMQLDLVRELSLAHVHHVELRGELPTDVEYQEWWANELHPTQVGFDLVTRRFSLALERALRA